MNRRTLLVGLAAGSAALAGCSTEESQVTGLGSIDVSNEREEGVEVLLRVDGGGEGLHDERYTLDGASNDELSVVEEWMGDGEYEIAMEVADGEDERTVSTAEFEETVSEWDDDCYHVRFVVGNGGIEEYVRGGECSGS